MTILIGFEHVDSRCAISAISGHLPPFLPPPSNMNTSKLRAAILVVSETASQDPSSDKCTAILQDVFETVGNDQWEVSVTQIIPDDVLEIQRFITRWTDGEDAVNLIISSGGTGFAVKDSTPEVKMPYPLTFKSNMTNSRTKRLYCLLYTDMHQG